MLANCLKTNRITFYFGSNSVLVAASAAGAAVLLSVALQTRSATVDGITVTRCAQHLKTMADNKYGTKL